VGLFVAALSFLGPFKKRVVLTPEALEEHDAAGRLSSAALPKVTVQALQPRAAQGGKEEQNRTSMNDTSTATEQQKHVTAMPVRAGSPTSAPVSSIAPPPGQATTAIDPFSSFTSAFPSSPRRRSSVPVSERLSFSEKAAENYRQHTAIPFLPVVLTFKNVEYSVPLPPGTEADPDEVPQSGPHANQLLLLRNIDGVFRPFVLTALMGATGAGKTTLMDVLAGRKTGGKITGDIRVNGHPKESNTFAKISGYVEQTDIHLPQASVEEALEFSAMLRLPTTVDAPTRKRFVNEILELVELDIIRNAFVGVPGVSGLSVEQRKRLTLAVELVANPSIVFLDEPTSGLDARAASVVVSAIRNTVNSGRTVVCTIHQPSYDIFEAFDELVLLKPGGRLVYNGPLGDGAKTLVEYLQSLPGVQPLPPRHNPANWMLSVTSPQGETAVHTDFAKVYAQSDVARNVMETIKQYEVPEAGSQPLRMEEMHGAPIATQLRANLLRFSRMYWRSPEYNLTRLAVTLGIAFVFGSLFWRQGNKTSTVVGVLNIAGVLFSSALFLGITNCLTVQHTVALQRTIMYRERAAGYYHILPFALAQQAVEIPYILVQTVLFSSIVYWMVYFAVDAGKFFLFMLFFFLTLLYFVIFGMLAVALTPAVALANVLCSFFFSFFNLFCGFLIPQPSMPVYYKYWIYWMNPVSWSLYSLAISQLGDLNDQDIEDFDGQVLTVPDFLAKRFNWHQYMMWPCVPILLGYTVLFSLGTYWALKKINYQRR
jgi:ABC-type multidrug transport system ATPase subunit/ABC-type multidrug transport system permease subunit